jgi:hypothetical protein
LKPELADPPPDGMFPAAFKEGTMAEAKLAPNLPDWMVEHANRYLTSSLSDLTGAAIRDGLESPS